MGFAAGNEVEGIWGRVGCCVVPAKGRAGRQAGHMCCWVTHAETSAASKMPSVLCSLLF